MGVVEWSALGAIIMIMVALGGVVVRLMDRLNKAEGKASAAEVRAVSASLQIETLNIQLVNHRVQVAQEYVSKSTLESLETKIVTAIDRLGDRIDNLLKVGVPRA